MMQHRTGAAREKRTALIRREATEYTFHADVTQGKGKDSYGFIAIGNWGTWPWPIWPSVSGHLLTVPCFL